MARRAPAKTTVVIGGGLNGLVAATCLARRGRSVILLERQASPGGSAITARVNFVERPITFSWDPVPGASRYVVDVGTRPGGADVFSAATTNLSVTTKFTFSGQVYPRVTAYSGRTGSHASESRVPLILLFFEDYVEALFLGTGPLARSPQTGGSTRRQLQHVRVKTSMVRPVLTTLATVPVTARTVHRIAGWSGFPLVQVSWKTPA